MPISDRHRIARKIKDLRSARGWTQSELARKLDTSQSRLSELERGDGSFSAEQFLEVLRLFNVTAHEFDGASGHGTTKTHLQQAVARLGARHLYESSDVVPLDELDDIHRTLCEVLANPSSRLVAALAPVLVLHADRISLHRVALELEAIGLRHRLAWLVDNTLEALDAIDLERASARLRKLVRRSQLWLRDFLTRQATTRGFENQDLLDPTIRSQKTLTVVEASRSSISRRWGIVSDLQPADFAKALEQSGLADP